MCCRIFFKFAIICSIFQILLGTSVMADDITSGSKNASSVTVDLNHNIENEQTNDSPDMKVEINDATVSNKEDKNLDDENLVDISILIGKDQLLKEMNIQITFENPEFNKDIISKASVDSQTVDNEEDNCYRNQVLTNIDSTIGSVDSGSLSVSGGVLEQKLKNIFQEKQDEIVSRIMGLRCLLNELYKNSEKEKLFDFLKSCELRAKILGDSAQKTLQIDLVSPTPINTTTLLEKTSLDNDRFLEIDLINR